MPRDYKLYLDDIAAAIILVRRFSKGLSFEQFKADEMVSSAILFQLHIVGEAAAHIPPELRQKYSQIPWVRIVALRNVISHEYFGLELTIIWDVVQHRLDELEPVIEAMLSEEPPPDQKE